MFDETENTQPTLSPARTDFADTPEDRALSVSDWTNVGTIADGTGLTNLQSETDYGITAANISNLRYAPVEISNPYGDLCATMESLKETVATLTKEVADLESSLISHPCSPHVHSINPPFSNNIADHKTDIIAQMMRERIEDRLYYYCCPHVPLMNTTHHSYVVKTTLPEDDFDRAMGIVK